ncbi:MAG: hypothetical protein IAE93_13140 [Ignavibacteria bacterium]|nr:hypothetical protein [Ignavibacteria bacterium]
MKQEVKTLRLKDLVLWTENPRDPIDPNSKDQDIVNRALGDQSTKWAITKLAGDMGKHYDFSELPTVVYHGKTPIVYDGNRRVILGKLKHGFAKAEKFDIASIPEFPLEIPCNVCTEDIALENVLRKHGDSGSWKPLERDIFLHKFMHLPKSIFLLMEENTGIISSNGYLNQGFVKQEIFKDDVLKEMGFEFVGEKLFTVHSDKQATEILSDLTQKITDRKITTRINRGKVFEVLDKHSLELIDNNKDSNPSSAKINFRSSSQKTEQQKQRLTKRTQHKEEMLFGGKLYLNMGVVSDLYRDIEDLYRFYLENKDNLSPSFPGLIRMALRLICEAACTDNNLDIDEYIQTHFENAKKNLDRDTKTTLANQNVTNKSLVQLLHTGAHNYQSSNNIAQTLAVSVILGEMIKITHGKTV